MLAYRQHLTVKNPQHLLLSNLPLKVGQQVEVLILVKEEVVEENANFKADKNNPTNNPTHYSEAEWDNLEPELRRELETQYILNNPILMEQIKEKSEWVKISPEQLGIDLKD